MKSRQRRTLIDYSDDFLKPIMIVSMLMLLFSYWFRFIESQYVVAYLIVLSAIYSLEYFFGFSREHPILWKFSALGILLIFIYLLLNIMKWLS